MDSNFPPLIFIILFFTVVAANSFHSHSHSTKNGCVETERRALMNFKKNVVHCYDHQYSSIASWAGDDCCTWGGIICSNITGNVIKLQLSSQIYCESALDGDVLLPLLSLHHLAHLDISGNYFFDSQIPKFIGSFPRLQSLDLSSSGFTGRVPDELGNLSILYELHIGGYAGLIIENTGWLSQLKSLRCLSMEFIDLSHVSGWLQALSTLPYISELGILSCQLKALQPLSDFNFTSLTRLDLRYNCIESLPGWLWDLKNLKFLDVSGNSLYGALPVKIGNLSILEALDLSSNNLRGPIPETIRHLRRLDYLNLASNFFNDNLQDIEFPSKLKTVCLGDNLFYGSFPATIRNLSSLEILSLPSNNLNKLIQENTRQLRSLQVLDISHNSLRCTLSDAHFSNMSVLGHLDFSYNPSLSFQISDNWIPSFKLHYLYLDFCQVRPKFPSWLKTQYSLLKLSLSNAGIRGLIPNWFVNFSSTLYTVNLSNNGIRGQLGHFYNSNFSYLNLSNNSLSGPIPKEFGKKMINLISLDLSSNNFKGSIPSSFCESVSLQFLRISNNKLSGQIPNCWSFQSIITTLEFSSNNFHGKIPLTLCNLYSLRELHLRDNFLTGNLPLCLTNIKSLISLDLGYNKLTGQIPLWIGTGQLKILILTSNALTGRIPYLSVTELQILDLSNNNLSGHIPTSLGSFAAMSNNGFRNATGIDLAAWLKTKGREFEYSSTILEMVTLLDLSNNALSGHILDEMVQLQGLQTLNLSENNLTGQISTNIDEMQQLETLDLSRNNLFGTIPWGMGELHFLADLDLSYNNLSGRIPTNGQLQTFENSSIYQGNPYLCGIPIHKVCLDETNQHGFNNYDEMHSDNDEDFIWLYMALALGFVVGFWLVWGTLILSKRWRMAYFQAIDRFYYKLFERI